MPKKLSFSYVDFSTTTDLGDSGWHNENFDFRSNNILPGREIKNFLFVYSVFFFCCNEGIHRNHESRGLDRKITFNFSESKKFGHLNTPILTVRFFFR